MENPLKSFETAITDYQLKLKKNNLIRSKINLYIKFYHCNWYSTIKTCNIPFKNFIIFLVPILDDKPNNQPKPSKVKTKNLCILLIKKEKPIINIDIHAQIHI